MRRLYIGLVVLICVALSSSACWAAGSEKTRATAPTSAKIEGVVRSIEKAQSLSEIASAVKNAKLSAKECQQLEATARAGAVAEKLRALMNAALAAAKPEAANDRNSLQILQQKRQALLKSRAGSLAQSKTRLIPLKANIGASRRASAARTVVSEKVNPAPVSSNQPTAHIGDCTQAQVGHQMTIRGEGFGASQGRVALLVRRDVYYCPISSWSDQRIVCTVTDEIEPVVGYHDQGVEAVLWIKLAGTESGPAQEIEVLPDPDQITPRITDVTPSEITPGQTFIIRGENLIKYASERPRVNFIFADRVTIPADIEECFDDFIQATMPDSIAGLQRTVCRLQVINDVEQRGDITVTFVPAEEIIAIRSNRMGAWCQPPFPGWLCLFGDANRFTVQDFRLINGWTVDEAVLDLTKRGPNAGAYFVEKPESGDTLARVIVEVWADAYSSASCVETLFIKGPKGVPYR